MITKEELIKKKAKDSVQLDLVESLETDKHLKNKKRWLIISLLLTIGLSLAFSLYRQFSNYKFSISVPKLNFSLPRSLQKSGEISDYQVSKIISDPGWSVSVAVFPNLSNFYNWSKNLNKFSSEQFNEKYQKLFALKPSIDSILTKQLPQGLVIKQELNTSAKGINLDALVFTPEKQLLFIFSSTSPDREKFQTIIDRLVPELYWSAIQME